MKKLESKPFALLGVNTGGHNADKLKQVMDKEKLPWRCFADPVVDTPGLDLESFHGPIARRWNLEGTPTLYLIDHKGVIRYRWLGGPGSKVIDEALEKLIKEAEK